MLQLKLALKNHLLSQKIHLMEKKKKDIAIKVLKGTNNETGTRITLNTIENTTES